MLVHLMLICCTKKERLDMGSKWAEAGILRKKQTKENFDDLLVFGYACKLFRDDERALHIDQGKHLIPWMGDERLKIDRYDGRGALSDLSQCEASREGYDNTRWLGLSESEGKLEQLCDEERYYSLHNNDDNVNMYKEEEAKRDGRGVNEFQYNYNVLTASESGVQVATCEEEDKPFVPAKELDVPVDIDIPKTVKENARIEKTALFISKQGPQMEILIKAKQSDNPQFSFMNQNDPLQKYYRHLLNAIKSGQYNPYKETELQKRDVDDATASNSSTMEDHYLHPSLAPLPTPQTVLPQLPTIPYKATADCAYTQLVSRIKGNSLEKQSTQAAEVGSNGQATQQQRQDQYYQYYQAQYYQYYSQIAQQYAAQGNCDVNTILMNQQLQEQIQQQAVHYAQVACHALNNTTPAKPVEKTQPKLSLVHYSSDSEEDSEDADDKEGTKEVYIRPPADVALIIKKMASYVSKNGISFEQIVRDKGDPRFDFLNETHKFYKFYKHTFNEIINKSSTSSDNVLNESDTETSTTSDSPKKLEQTMLQVNNKKDKDKELKSKRSDKLREKKIVTPVSFSIKKAKEETTKDIKSALTAEESDEEAVIVQEKEENLALPTMVPPPVVLPVSVPVSVVLPSLPVETPIAITMKEETTSKILVDDPIFEMINLPDEIDEKRELKIADERIKDKLASAVREKALQMERKKRAALFLKMQSETTTNSSNNTESKAESIAVSVRIVDDSVQIPKADEFAVEINVSESELEEGEIKFTSVKPKDSYRKSSRKRSSKNRCYESKSSRHRKHKKRRPSTSPSSSSSSDSK